MQNPVNSDFKSKNTQLIEKNRNKIEIKSNEKKTFNIFNAKSPLNNDKLVLRNSSKKKSDGFESNERNNENLKKYLVNFESQIFNYPNSARINYK